MGQISTRSISVQRPHRGNQIVYTSDVAIVEKQITILMLAPRRSEGIDRTQTTIFWIDEVDDKQMVTEVTRSQSSL